MKREKVTKEWVEKIYERVFEIMASTDWKDAIDLFEILDKEFKDRDERELAYFCAGFLLTLAAIKVCGHERTAKVYEIMRTGIGG